MEKSQQESENEVTVVRCDTTVEASNEKQVINDIEKQKAPSVHSQTNTALKDPEHHPEKPKTLREKINVGILAFGIALAMFMVSLNTIVIGPALRTDLNRSNTQVWSDSMYFLSLMVFQPLPEKFFNIFDRKGAFLFAIALFFIGCLINPLATSINMLTVGRSIQAFGCGGINSVAYFIITDIAPIHLRPRFQSILPVICWLTSTVHPSIGGTLVDKLNWHWVSWINAIFGGITYIMMVQQGTNAR